MKINRFFFKHLLRYGYIIFPLSPKGVIKSDSCRVGRVSLRFAIRRPAKLNPPFATLSTLQDNKTSLLIAPIAQIAQQQLE